MENTSSPEELETLVFITRDGLKGLNLDGKRLTHVPEGVTEMIDLEVLVLSNNRLKGLPHNFFNLSQLKGLHLGKNRLRKFPDVIGDLKNLVKLDVSHNQLTTIGESIEGLKQLEELNLAENELGPELPDVICHLKKLIYLDLSDNNLARIPNVICQLKKLLKLDVSGNNLSSVPDGIKNLEQLQELYLRRTKLLELPPAICQLKDLNTLDVSGNQLTSIPDNIAALNQLQHLYLSGNKLKEIPEAICQLKKLNTFHVSHNQLTSIPDNIAALNQLQNLFLRGNRLKEIPEAICQLKKLNKLHVSSNQLTSIPDNIAALNQLQYLYLSGNRLKELPEAICQLQNLAILTLRGNPLKVPPIEICARGLSAITAYFLEFRCGKTFHHKVVLLGASGAGKTSLANTLVNNKPSCVQEEDRTIVLDRRKWEVERDGKILNITMADFGGNHWYKVVHHLFLDKDALILLVVNLERYSEKTFNEDVRCWLDVITSRVPKASVLLVGTHIDCLQDEGKVHWRRNQVLQDILCLAKDDNCEKIDIVSKEMYLVSSSCFTGIDVLRNALIDFVSKHGKVVPVRWARIRTELQNGMDQRFWTLNSVEEMIRTHLQDNENSEQELKAIAKTYKPLSEPRIGEDEMSQAETVLTFFHDIGSLLWYKHSSEVRKFVFHRPEFLTKLMKAVFSERLSDESLSYQGQFKFLFTSNSFEEAKEDLLKRGIMSQNLLKGLWNHLDLESELFIAMLELLVQLDLCYPMNDAFGNKCLRFPWFLTEEAPKISGAQKMLIEYPSLESYRLCLRYLYPARCPPPLYHIFVVRLHRHVHDIKSLHEWKDGVYALVGETEMLVNRSDQSTEKVICVSVEGSDLVVVWKVLLSCHQELKGVMSDWPGLRWECWIVCPYCIRRGITSPGIFKSEQLETDCPRGKVTCDRHNERVPACLVFPIKDGDDYRVHQKVLEEYKSQVVQKDIRCSSNQDYLQNVTFKTTKLSQKDLHCLSQDVCSSWKPLGRQLGLTDNHLTQIEADNPGLTYEHCYVMLREWYQAKFPLNCKDLGRALQIINREDLMLKYCAVHGASGFEERSCSAEKQWSYKDGSPTEQEINDLTYRVLEGGNWKQLGRSLNLPDADLAQIDHDCRDLFEKSYGMLKKWTQREGSAAIYVNLANGLNEMRRRDLVQEFCCDKK